MTRIITAAALALAVCACTSSRDTGNWISVSAGVGHVLTADAAATLPQPGTPARRR
ncbi:hypothetical protein FHS82_001085 [Pseudochelatococcus lubricantis]|uniref:Lipoprotein n=1 Tax=Pseudochelatococcus lubricantis TaxID=1538102 RepID=A0ABX0UWC9_9HYPH|nr:hypothetical protein [Pseudochelatococcus lubricantis]NIJ57259.1 hypothetical protein [Pseudochelatococcus lubricantis]